MITLTGSVLCEVKNRLIGGLWSMRRMAPVCWFGSIALIVPFCISLFAMKCFGISDDLPNFVIYANKLVIIRIYWLDNWTEHKMHNHLPDGVSNRNIQTMRPKWSKCRSGWTRKEITHFIRTFQITLRNEHTSTPLVLCCIKSQNCSYFDSNELMIIFVSF